MDIIIVNWNAGKQLAEAVSSIAQYHCNLVASLIIVDNDSSDNSIGLVESLENLPFPLKIIRNSENKGFGAACNQGAALAKSDYLLFLNPDTRLFQDSLSVPWDYMQRKENADVGIVGIQLVDERGEVARSCARFPSPGLIAAQALGVNHIPGLKRMGMHMSDWGHNQTRSVDHVIGAFYLIRRSLFERLEGFDERFFVYLEDLDLSFRANQAGWRSVYLTEAQAFHAGGGTSRQIKARRLFYSLNSRLIYGFKHFERWQAWMLAAITLILEPLSRMAFSALKRQDFKNTITAYYMLYRACAKNEIKHSGRHKDTGL